MSVSTLDQLKRVSWFLILSVSLNGILIGLIAYIFYAERPPTPICERKPSISQKSLPPQTLAAEASTLILAMKKLSLGELNSKLDDERIVEMGYSVRDLSLASLNGFYQIDIEKALKHPLEEKVLQYGEKGETLSVFPGLGQDDYLKIKQFLEIEQWPFKPEGLFKLLKKEKWQDEVTLKETFYLTPQFITFETLFSPAPFKLEKEELLTLLLSAEWGKLQGYYERHKQIHDLSESEKRLILIDYLLSSSKPAAELILKSDFDFAVKKLDDKSTLKMLFLLKDKSPLAEKYAKDILSSPRSDSIRRVALERIFEYQGSPLPPQFDFHQALKKLFPEVPSKKTVTPIKPLALPKTPPLKKNTPPPLKKEKVVLVQAGDTLEKIAKQYKISAKTIKQMNGLESDQIKPGVALRIPL